MAEDATPVSKSAASIEEAQGVTQWNLVSTDDSVPLCLNGLCSKQRQQKNGIDNYLDINDICSSCQHASAGFETSACRAVAWPTVYLDLKPCLQVEVGVSSLSCSFRNSNLVGVSLIFAINITWSLAQSKSEEVSIQLWNSHIYIIYFIVLWLNSFAKCPPHQVASNGQLASSLGVQTFA